MMMLLVGQACKTHGTSGIVSSLSWNVDSIHCWYSVWYHLLILYL